MITKILNTLWPRRWHVCEPAPDSRGYRIVSSHRFRGDAVLYSSLNAPYRDDASLPVMHEREILERAAGAWGSHLGGPYDEGDN